MQTSAQKATKTGGFNSKISQSQRRSKQL